MRRLLASLAVAGLPRLRGAQPWRSCVRTNWVRKLSTRLLSGAGDGTYAVTALT